MSEDFVAAMRRAALAAQGSDPTAATRIVQEALAASGLGAKLPMSLPGGTFPGGALPSLPSGMFRSATPQALPGGRGLGAVIKQLREGGFKLPQTGDLQQVPGAEPAVPEGARFETATFTAPEGSRRYRLYIPTAVAAGDAPQGLVLMLHGCTQTPEDFAAGTGMNAVAEAANILVAYPAQERSQNSHGCWNWFRPGDQHGGEAALLAGLVREIAATHGVPRGRIYAAGLSAGGAMAAILGESHPQDFAAIGVHSGLPAGAASDVISAFAAMRGEIGGLATPARVPTIVFHGTADHTVSPGNAARLAGPAAPATTIHGETAGRSYRRSVSAATANAAATECWMIDGAGHAWSGGNPAGSYADAAGPDASAEMLRFFRAASAE